jgi:hypothetical protein
MTGLKSRPFKTDTALLRQMQVAGLPFQNNCNLNFHYDRGVRPRHDCGRRTTWLIPTYATGSINYKKPES